MDVPLPAGPPFFRFSEPNECLRTLFDASFIQPCVTKIPQIWRLDSPEALFEIMRGGTVRTAGLLRAQTSEALTAIGSAIRNSIAIYRKGDGYGLPMPAVLASGRKP